MFYLFSPTHSRWKDVVSLFYREEQKTMRSGRTREHSDMNDFINQARTTYPLSPDGDKVIIVAILLSTVQLLKLHGMELARKPSLFPVYSMSSISARFVQ
jgi:hypothetical protein